MVYARLATSDWGQGLSSGRAGGACSIERGSPDVTDTAATGRLGKGGLEGHIWGEVGHARMLHGRGKRSDARLRTGYLDLP